SSLKISCWVMVPPRPPYSLGHPRPIEPASPSFFSHSRWTSQPVSSAGPPPPPSAAYSPTRLSFSQERTSSRKASSSALQRKSIGPGHYLTARSSRILTRMPVGATPAKSPKASRGAHPRPPPPDSGLPSAFSPLSG